LKKDGSEKVISRRFSKPSNPIGDGGGGGESMSMVSRLNFESSNIAERRN
jgi:hypothetical protein